MKLIKCFLFSVAMLMMVTSCSNVENQIEEQIPADAVVVVKADVAQLIQHSGVQVNGDKLTLPPKLKELMAQDASEVEAMEKEFAKLKNSGIDFNSCSYAFVTDKVIGDSGDDVSSVALIPIDDHNKLINFLKNECDASITEKDGMKIGKNADGFVFVIKDDVMCLTMSNLDNAADRVIAMTSPSSNMTAKDEIVKALGTDDDVNVFVDSKRINKLVSKNIDQYYSGEELMFIKSMLDISDAQSAAYHLSLADNEWNIRCENNYDKNSDMAKLLDKVSAKPDASLFSMMPNADNAVIFSLCINGENIAQMDMVKPFIAQAQEDPDFARLIDLFKSINGPIVAGVATDDLSSGKFNGMLAVNCGKANQLPDLIGILPFADVVSRDGNEFVVPQESPSDPKVTLGFKDNLLYAKASTSDNSATMGNADVKSLFADSRVAFYCTSKIDNMQMQITAGSKDLKNSNAKFWVTENGKKLSPLDALVFFAKLQENGVNF